MRAAAAAGGGGGGGGGGRVDRTGMNLSVLYAREGESEETITIRGCAEKYNTTNPILPGAGAGAVYAEAFSGSGTLIDEGGTDSCAKKSAPSA